MNNFSLGEIRGAFPMLAQTMHGKPLAYLDNAATTLKPRSVIEKEREYYEAYTSNIHRGVYYFSALASQQFEEVRETAQKFFDAPHKEELIFVRGATEGINLVAHSFGKAFIQAGDEILISAMEHHANIVPWQMVARERGAVVKVIPIDEHGDVQMEEYKKLLTDKTKIVAVTYVSNALGTVNPVKEMIALAHEKNIPVLIDGCQAAQHIPLSLRELECDFFVCSGHKMYGPTGVGLLYGKRKYLDAMPPYQTGGDMIASVSFEETTFAPLPAKFEAGTPNIAGVIGFGEALRCIEHYGRKEIAAYEQELLAYATEQVGNLPKVRLIGTAKEKTSVLSFVIEGIHPHDIGTVLDTEGVAIRTGQHCAEPVMKHFGVEATARLSVSFYNTKEDIDQCVRALQKTLTLFG